MELGPLDPGGIARARRATVRDPRRARTASTSPSSRRKPPAIRCSSTSWSATPPADARAARFDSTTRCGRASLRSMPRSRGLLEVITLAGEPLHYDTLVRAADIAPELLGRTLSVLRVANLVRTTGVGPTTRRAVSRPDPRGDHRPPRGRATHGAPSRARGSRSRPRRGAATNRCSRSTGRGPDARPRRAVCRGGRRDAVETLAFDRAAFDSIGSRSSSAIPIVESCSCGWARRSGSTAVGPKPPTRISRPPTRRPPTRSRSIVAGLPRSSC